MANHFDQSAATWDSEPHRIALMQAVGEAILREARPTRELNALDYGCGTGLVSLFLLPHVRSVTGADNSPGMLEVLRNKIHTSQVDNMRVLQLDLEQIKSKLSSAGFSHARDVTAHVVRKPGEKGTDREFPVFLIIAEAL